MKGFNLRDLDAFVAVARTRNFRRAALEQGVSVSSLSQRLRDMEERLGVRLMNRTTRSVALTEAGELLLAGVGPAISDVDDALDRVRGLRGVPSGRLRINAPPPAIDLVLAPMVGPFLKAHPQIDLEIVSDSALVDIVATGFDAGVRYEEHLAQDMIAARSSAPLGGGGFAALYCAARPAETSEGSAQTRRHSLPFRQRRDAGLGVREGRSCRESRAVGQIDRDRSGVGEASRAGWRGFLADRRGICARGRAIRRADQRA